MYYIQVLVVTNSAVLWYNMVRRWGECYKSMTNVSEDDIPQQVIYLSRRDTSPGEGTPASMGMRPVPGIYRRRQAGSCKLDTRVGELQAAKGENIMWLIGGGFMFSGLLIGALSGSVTLCLGIVGFGMVLIGCYYAQEQYKERQSQAWRKNYPSYRY